MYLFPWSSLYKIFYQHCNKCLYPSLWNIALKDIKNHSPHEMTWMEKVSKQSTILCSSHYTVHWIPSAVWSGAQWVIQQTPHHWLSMPHLSATSAGPTSSCKILVTGVWWLFQPPCDCRLHSCICCEPTQKIKKSSSIFSFLTIFNKILKHLTYIWYYTTGSFTITRHDKFECYSQVLEYMYYMHDCPSCQTVRT